MASRMARWLPAAASRPWISTSTRSASCSTSPSTWELTITVRPSAPSRRKRSTSFTRCTGSAPLRGSSSTSTAGSVTRAAATLARCRIPLLNPARRRSAAGSMSTESSARVGGAVGVGHPVQLGDVAHQLAGGQAGRDGLVLRDQGDAPVDLAVGAGVTSVDPHPSRVHPDEAGDGPHERALAGAVGPEEARHARPERARQLGQGHLLPEPDRRLVDHDGGVGDEGGVARFARPGGRHRVTALTAPPTGSATGGRRRRRPPPPGRRRRPGPRRR